MLKRFTIWLLIFAVSAANFSMAFVYAGFKVNQSYISKTLCINRFRPAMHCDGKCYFMRKLKQAEENEKKQTERDGSVRLEISFCQEPFNFVFIQPQILKGERSSFVNYTYTCINRYKDAIFKPPPSA